MIYQKLIANLKAFGFGFDKKIAIAVSGGVDSICMMHLMNFLSREKGFEIIVLHFDHALRKSSSSDADFVGAECLRLGVEHKCFVWSNDIILNANIQEKARDARYNALTKYCFNNNIEIMLTAHHKNDFLESFYMRRMRKASIMGLSSSYIYYKNRIRIIRPFFNITKQDLLSYVEEQKILWQEDESNISDKYERNRVREIINSLNIKEHEFLSKELEWVNQEAILLNKKYSDSG